MNTRGVVAVLILVVIVIAAIWYFSSAPSAATTTTGATATSTDQNLAAAENTVQGFGMAQQQVSLLAPDASTTMADVYAPFVDPTLLATWEADPPDAPAGRVASSPWPDHITITNAMQTPSGYEIDGNLVMMTSTGEEGEVPLVIDLQQENGQWLIVNYQSLATSTAASSSASTQ